MLFISSGMIRSLGIWDTNAAAAGVYPPEEGEHGVVNHEVEPGGKLAANQRPSASDALL
jgi:hypothetical protein